MFLLISWITNVITLLYFFPDIHLLAYVLFLLFAHAIIMPHPLPISLSLTLKHLKQRLLKSCLYTITIISTHRITLFHYFGCVFWQEASKHTRKCTCISLSLSHTRAYARTHTHSAYMHAFTQHMLLVKNLPLILCLFISTCTQ